MNQIKISFNITYTNYQIEIHLILNFIFQVRKANYNHKVQNKKKKS